MNTEGALKVVPADETKGQIKRTSGGQFTEGTCGGSGGSRPGGGRPPKPADETLLKRLYGLLDGNAGRALGVLVEQLDHEDPKVAQKAALAVLGKVLPEGRLLKTWEKDSGNKAGEIILFKEFLVWKMEKDLKAIKNTVTLANDLDFRVT